MMEIKAKAPCRISIAGGGSDFPEYYKIYGGAVLNFGISLYSYTSLKKTNKPYTRIISHDWDIERNITDLTLEFDSNKKTNVDVVKAVMSNLKLNPKDGYELTIHSAAGKNSGLAGSSALLVSMMAAFYNLAGKSLMNRDDMARTAYTIERETLKRFGGVQDSIACVYGGFNFMEFNVEGIRVHPLKISSDLLAELHSSMLLFNLPIARKDSASVVERKKMDNMNNNILQLAMIGGLAYRMKDALMQGNIPDMGNLLDQGWKAKRSMTGVSTPEIDRLYDIGIKAGAYGGKLCGAGGGGSMLFMSDLSNRKKVIRAMENAGATHTNFDFDQVGALSWRVER